MAQRVTNFTIHHIALQGPQPSAIATWDLRRAWEKHPGIPSFSQRIFIPAGPRGIDPSFQSLEGRVELSQILVWLRGPKTYKDIQALQDDMIGND